MGDFNYWRADCCVRMSFASCSFFGKVQLSIETKTEVISRSISAPIRGDNYSSPVVAEVWRTLNKTNTKYLPIPLMFTVPSNAKSAKTRKKVLKTLHNAQNLTKVIYPPLEPTKRYRQ